MATRKSKPKGTGNADVYGRVTDRILTELKNGVIPWRRPWNGSVGRRPRSMSTGKVYRGVNFFMLHDEQYAQGYTSPYWGTFGQIAEKAGMVKTETNGRVSWSSPDDTPRGIRKGEKSGTFIVFWKESSRPVNEQEKATGETGDKNGMVHMRFARAYSVFNACQADGLPGKYFPDLDTDTANDVDHLADADRLIQAYVDRGPSIRKAYQNRANYRPGPDVITLPLDNQFETTARRYGTTFHELTHSTGHARRLNRPGIAEFDHHGSDQYSAEELIAELGSAMLSVETGIDPAWEQSASYIAGWAEALGDNPKLFSQAASKAEAAARYITGETE